MSYEEDTKAWQAIQDKEFIKLLIADMRRARDDIELHTLNHNPLNPDAAFDRIYLLAKQMERDLSTLYGIFLEDWAEAVRAVRHGAEFQGDEAADIELIRNIHKTKEMGRSTRKRTGTGRWKRITR